MGELIPLVPHPWDKIGPPQPLGAPSIKEMEVLADKIRALKSQGDRKTDEAEALKEEAATLERDAEELFDEAIALLDELKEMPGGEELSDELDDELDA